MKILIYYLSFLIFFSNNVKAHECVLSGTSAKEITIYNTCLTQQNKNNNLVTISMLKVKIDKLEKENLLLKEKLLEIKTRFDNISSIIDAYTNHWWKQT